MFGQSPKVSEKITNLFSFATTQQKQVVLNLLCRQAILIVALQKLLVLYKLKGRLN